LRTRIYNYFFNRSAVSTPQTADTGVDVRVVGTSSSDEQHQLITKACSASVESTVRVHTNVPAAKANAPPSGECCSTSDANDTSTNCDQIVYV
jgi:hypothetical protein